MAGSLTIDNINGKVISSSPVATESQIIGVGQTWQDVKTSRSAGVTYTNNTGKPIVVSVGTYLVTGTVVGIVGYVDGVTVGESRNDDYDAVSRTANVVLIVPNGSTYNFSNIGGSLIYWAELR